MGREVYSFKSSPNTNSFLEWCDLVLLAKGFSQRESDVVIYQRGNTQILVDTTRISVKKEDFMLTGFSSKDLDSLIVTCDGKQIGFNISVARNNWDFTFLV